MRIAKAEAAPASFETARENITPIGAMNRLAGATVECELTQVDFGIVALDGLGYEVFSDTSRTRALAAAAQRD